MPDQRQKELVILTIVGLPGCFLLIAMVGAIVARFMP